MRLKMYKYYKSNSGAIWWSQYVIYNTFTLNFHFTYLCIPLACEQSHLWVTHTSSEEQSDSAGKSLVNRCQESHHQTSRCFAASLLDFEAAPMPRVLVLQREPARRLHFPWGSGFKAHLADFSVGKDITLSHTLPSFLKSFPCSFITLAN